MTRQIIIAAAFAACSAFAQDAPEAPSFDGPKDMPHMDGQRHQDGRKADGPRHHQDGRKGDGPRRQEGGPNADGPRRQDGRRGGEGRRENGEHTPLS